MNPLRIGAFRQRVTLQVLSSPEVRDTFAQPIQTWVNLGTYAAEVKPLRGAELVVAMQVKAQAYLLVRMRYLGASVLISPQNRLLLNGRQLGIGEVRNIEERNRCYEMTCFEIQASGPV